MQETLLITLSKDDLISIVQQAVKDAMLLNSNNQPLPASDSLLSIKEAAELISLSVPTLYAYVSKSAIPHMKKGKRLYFSKDELTEWIKKGKRKTQSEVDADTDHYLSERKK